MASLSFSLKNIHPRTWAWGSLILGIVIGARSPWAWNTSRESAMLSGLLTGLLLMTMVMGIRFFLNSSSRTKAWEQDRAKDQAIIAEATAKIQAERDRLRRKWQVKSCHAILPDGTKITPANLPVGDIYLARDGGPDLLYTIGIYHAYEGAKPLPVVTLWNPRPERLPIN